MSGNEAHDGQERPRCGAKTRSGGSCGQAAGWGTDHPGSGKCKLHGGASTGPKSEEGKKRIASNAIKHGGYVDKLLNDPERELYEVLFADTITKYGLDEMNPMHMATLHRCCMSFVKTVRLDEWEMVEEFEPYELVKNKKGRVMMGADGQPMMVSHPVFNLEGEKIGEQTGHVRRIRWAQGAPSWERHFQKYLTLLGTDRGREVADEGKKGNEKADGRFSWLWGQKSMEGAGTT